MEDVDHLRHPPGSLAKTLVLATIVLLLLVYVSTFFMLSGVERPAGKRYRIFRCEAHADFFAPVTWVEGFFVESLLGSEYSVQYYKWDE